MKKSLLAATLVGSALLTGCATPTPIGTIFTDVSLPVNATAGTTSGKMGVATCQSILGAVATGDCSIEAAKQNGGITEVTHMDWKANNILGVIGKYELRVYGR